MFLAILFATLLPSSSGKTNDEHSTKMFENHGVMLKPKGVITFSSENMISIFRKHKLPFLTGPTNCNNDWIGQYNNKLLSLAKEHVTLFENIAAPPVSRRKKRNLAIAAIGLGVFDLVLGGIGYGSLKHHINSVEEHFNNFVDEQHKFDDQVIEFEKSTVKIFTKLTNELNEKMAKIQCQILVTTGELLAKQYLHEWDEKLKKSFFTPLLNGAVKTRLTPDILNPSELNYILSNHTLIHQTYYAKNIYTFYNVAHISVVQSHFDLINGIITVHQVLHYPHVNVENIYPMFKTHQVGLVSKDQCLLIDMPEFMYLKNNLLFAVDTNNCEVSSSPITSCFAEILKSYEPNECLRNLTSCPFIHTTCKTRYVYDSSGMLIGSSADTDIQVFATSENALKKSLKIVKPTKLGTRFIPWQNVSYVQVEQILVEKPAVITSFVNFNVTTSILEKWQNKISNFTLPQITIPTTDSPNPSQNWHTLVIATFGALAIISFLTAITLTIIFIRRNRNKEMNNFAENQIAPDHGLSLEQTNEPHLDVNTVIIS